MLRSIQQAAGLADPPTEFFTNDSESVNSVIKQFLKFKKSDWPTFNENIKRFAMDQQEEVSKTIIGTGQYVLKEKYCHFAITPSMWFTTLTVEQKEKAKRKLQNAYVYDISYEKRWMHYQVTTTICYRAKIRRVRMTKCVTLKMKNYRGKVKLSCCRMRRMDQYGMKRMVNPVIYP